MQRESGRAGHRPFLFVVVFGSVSAAPGQTRFISLAAMLVFPLPITWSSLLGASYEMQANSGLFLSETVVASHPVKAMQTLTTL